MPKLPAALAARTTEKRLHQLGLERARVTAVATKPAARAELDALRLLVLLAVTSALGCSKKHDPPLPSPSLSASTAASSSAAARAPLAPTVCGENPEATGMSYVALDDAARAQFHARSRIGLVAVKYTPCGRVEVVSSCAIRGSYFYGRAPNIALAHFANGAEAARAVYGLAPFIEKAKDQPLDLDYATIGVSIARPEPDAAATLAACPDATHVVVRFTHGAIRVYIPSTRTGRRDDSLELFGRDAPSGCGPGNSETERDGGVSAPSTTCAGAAMMNLLPKAEARDGLAEYMKKEADRLKTLAEQPPEQQKDYLRKVDAWANVAPSAAVEFRPRR